MPLPGEQHRTTSAAANPFETPAPRISEYTAKELATLQSRLDKQLGPEFISSRPGAGGVKVHYIAAEKVINLANEVFGFNGWSSQIQNVQVDFVDENPHTGKISLGLSTIVRVTLKDGSFHEDLGYGAIENCKGKAPAFEKAKKEAVTDALKRALRNFGNVLGNCLYDKDYLSKIAKVKAVPTKWDEDNLHRHPDFIQPKRDSSGENVAEAEQQAQTTRVADYNDMDDEFGMDLLDEVEINSFNPDEVAMPAPSHFQTPQTAAAKNGSGPPPAMSVAANNQPNSTVNGINGGTSHINPNQAAFHNNQSSNPPVGFITSRAAEALTGQGAPPTNLANLPKFDPNADSPSIRKTSGVNHATSAPVTKSFVNGGASSNTIANAPTNQPTAASNAAGGNKTSPANNLNPSDGVQRRIGAPPTSIGSPHSNRSMYKPPTIVSGVKRPHTPTGVAEGPTATRVPLSDVSNVDQAPTTGPTDVSGEESKRAKTTSN